jgi:hypothetical protein
MTGRFRMPHIWEDPKYQESFDAMEEEDERNRVQARLDNWQREATSENLMRRKEEYYLASMTPPKEWDGTTSSALEYFIKTRTRTRPQESLYARTTRYNFPTTTDHSLPRIQPSSHPVYDGPAPDNWILNRSLIRTQRERSQGPGSSTQGRRHGESTWEDVNMYGDAGPSNDYQTSRFAPNGEGTYAKLQRRL